MTPSEFKDIRHAIGWTVRECAHVLGLAGTNGADTVRKWERGQRPITGPAKAAMRAFMKLHQQKATERPPASDSK